MLGPETPCEPWITEDDLCCDLAGVDPLLVAAAIEASTGYLYDRTCRRWPGVCTATVRPCKPCGCVRDCRCQWTREPLQAAHPIIEILAFVVNGVDQSAFVRLDNNRDMTLLEGAPFGSCFPPQNMGLPDNDPGGTWSVQYSFGAVRIAMAARAAADLACRLIDDCPSGDCDQPDNLESVTKRGATFRFRLPSDGVTNVTTADWLIGAYKCPETGTRRLLDPEVRPHVYRGP